MIVDQHLDYDVINALKEVMEDDFTFLIETYFLDSNSRIAALRSSAELREADGIRRAAHSFKGSCSNLGATHLAGLCGALERNSLQENFVSLDADISAIEEEFILVKKMLQEFLLQSPL